MWLMFNRVYFTWNFLSSNLTKLFSSANPETREYNEGQNEQPLKPLGIILPWFKSGFREPSWCRGAPERCMNCSHALGRMLCGFGGKENGDIRWGIMLAVWCHKPQNDVVCPRKILIFLKNITQLLVKNIALFFLEKWIQ